MTKQQALDIIKLLSALESWSFANNQGMPDYLYDSISKAIEVLTTQVIE